MAQMRFKGNILYYSIMTTFDTIDQYLEYSLNNLNPYALRIVRKFGGIPVDECLSWNKAQELGLTSSSLHDAFARINASTCDNKYDGSIGDLWRIESGYLITTPAIQEHLAMRTCEFLEKRDNYLERRAAYAVRHSELNINLS